MGKRYVPLLPWLLIAALIVLIVVLSAVYSRQVAIELSREARIIASQTDTLGDLPAPGPARVHEEMARENPHDIKY